MPEPGHTLNGVPLEQRQDDPFDQGDEQVDDDQCQETEGNQEVGCKGTGDCE